MLRHRFSALAPSRPLARTTVAALAAMLLAAPSAARAQSGVTLTVQSAANFREHPSTSAHIIRTLAVGDTVVLLTAHTSHDYLNVLSGADTGWVFSRLVELQAAGVVAVITPAVSAPSISHGVVSSAPASYHSCAITGNPNPNGANFASIKALNRLKNRYHAPDVAAIDPQFTLAALLAPGADDDRFDTAKAGVLEGIVVDVKMGGIETVNCGTHDALYRDTHIEVADRADAPENERVIVEVTPRWRAAMKRAGVDWTTSGLQSLIGQRVRFTGWQFFDSEHRNEAENTAPGHAGNWRATVWELHPVTSFEVVTH